jgi:hypothetical protein
MSNRSVFIPDNTADRYPGRGCVDNIDAMMTALPNLPDALMQQGFESLRKGQDAIVHSVLKLRDTLGVLPTGQGKSACYVTPALCHRFRTLVFSPLTALMSDQVSKLARLGLKAGAVSSLSNDGTNHATLEAWRSGELQFLFVAPERIPNKHFAEVILQMRPDMVVIDEAHVVANWSDNFRPEYKMIGDLIRVTAPKVVLALTATCPDLVENEIRSVFCLQDAVRLTYYPRRKNLVLNADTSNADDGRVFQYIIDSATTKGQTMVYCGSIKNVEKVTNVLQSLTKLQVGIYHGQLPDAAKRAGMDAFMSGDASIIVCTNAFGMGIDKPDVRAVVHYDIPGSIESLAQECVDVNSNISTKDGDRPAHTLGVGDLIRTDKGEGAITKVFKGHTKAWVIIKTGAGNTLKVTPNHPIFTYNRGFVVAEKLTTADRVQVRPVQNSLYHETSMWRCYAECDAYVKMTKEFWEWLRHAVGLKALQSAFGWARPYEWTSYAKKKSIPTRPLVDLIDRHKLPFNKLTEGFEYFTSRAVSKKWVTPLSMTADFGWLLGIIATDGNIKVGNGFGGQKCQWIVRLGITNKDIADKMERICKSWGFDVSRKTTPGKTPTSTKTVTSRKSLITVSVSSKLLVMIMEYMGIPRGKKSYVVACPKVIISANSEFKAGYLAGLLDGDGNFGKKKQSIRLHTASWNMVTGVTRLLWQLGIQARVSIQDYERNAHIMTCAEKHGYSVEVGRTKEVKKLWDLVRAHVVKCKEMIFSNKCRGQKRQEDWGVLSVEVVNLENSEPTINFTVEPQHTFYVDSTLTHNCGRAGRDGNESICMTFLRDTSVNLQRFFILNGYAHKADTKRVFSYLKDMCAKSEDGTFFSTQQDIGKGAKVNGVEASIQLLYGRALIGKEVGSDLASIQIKGTESSPQFQAFINGLTRCSIFKDGKYAFRLSELASSLATTDATARNRIKDFATRELLAYTPAARGTKFTIRPGGDVDEIDFTQIEQNEADAYAKLQRVQQYCHLRTTDARHAFIEAEFGIK